MTTPTDMSNTSTSTAGTTAPHVSNAPVPTGGTARPAAPSSSSAPTGCVVLSLGSCSLRYGFSDDFQPKSKPMVIAYRKKTEQQQQQQQETTSQQTAEDDTLTILNPEDSAALTAWTEDGKAEYEALNEQLSVPLYEAGGATTTVHLSNDPDDSWTDVSHQPAYVTGAAALHIHPTQPYLCRYPIRRGRFNSIYTLPTYPSHHLHDTGVLSFSECIDQLYLILRDTLSIDLEIPTTDFSQYSVVLSIPDTFSTREIVCLAELLLARLGVKDVLLHRNSVLACYGTGYASGCVVDIGGQSTVITCVDDGNIVPNTTISLNYAGDDLTATLLYYMLQHDHYFPYPHIEQLLTATASASLYTAVAWHQLTAAKEKVLLFAAREFAYQWIELREYTTAGKTIVHKMNVSTAAVITPRALFRPQLIPVPTSPYEPLSVYLSAPLPPPADSVYSSMDTVDPVSAVFLRTSLFYPFTAEYQSLQNKPVQSKWEQILTPPPSASTTATTTTGATAVNGELAPIEEGSRKKKRRKVKQEGSPVSLIDTASIADDASINTTTGASSSTSINKRAATPQVDNITRKKSPSPPPVNIPIPAPSPPPSTSTSAAAGSTSATATTTTAPSLPVLTDAELNALIDPQLESANSLSPVQFFLQHRLSVVDAITTSLSAVVSVDTRARLCSSIILAGGGCKITNFYDALSHELRQTLPIVLADTLTAGAGHSNRTAALHVDGSREVECIWSPKLLDVAHLSWKGAAVLASVRMEGLSSGGGSAQHWITREDWNKVGPKILREKVPFNL